MPITFNNADVKFVLKHKRALREFIQNEFLKVTGKEINVSYVFCSDDFLLNINKQFLNHDYYTDIITFPLATSKTTVDAEIYISVQRVRENAASLNYTFNDELLRVVFHGILHLAGYKDKTGAQKNEMRQQEDVLIKSFRNFLLK